MPRKYKLTWQPGSERNPAGRWKKKYKGKTHYFPGGRGKTDRQAYEAALLEWEKRKLEIDALLPKPHQVEYERAIGEWEAVLTWCREHPSDDEMARTAQETIEHLRRRFSAAKPKPVHREDTFVALFDRPEFPQLAEIFARLDSAEIPDAAEPQWARFDNEIDPSKHDFLQSLDPPDPGQERLKLWQDRLEVMSRSAGPEEETIGAYLEQFIVEKKASVAAGEISAGRDYTLQLHLTHFRDWAGGATPVVDIGGKLLRQYRVALLEEVKAKKWSRTTASHRLNSVKSFIRWLWEEDAIPSLPRIMGSRSKKKLNISRPSARVVLFDKPEIAALIGDASDRTKLYILLMLNCGMTQKDISDLDMSEVDWDAGRIIRKRSKTKDEDNVPIVNYLLWPETLRLLRQERCENEVGRVLLNDKGRPLWFEEVGDGGKLRKNDNVRSAFERLKRKTGVKKPLKSLKKTSASLIRDNPRYASLEDLFLGHAPQRMSEKHYTSTPQTLFDEAVTWLRSELEISAALAAGE